MNRTQALQTKKNKFLKNLKQNYWLYLFVLPTVIWYIIFHYVPMGGIVIAFKRYNGVRSIMDSPWVGFHWFREYFKSYYFWPTLRNTLVLSLYGLALFPTSVILALVLNEIRNQKAKKIMQTIMYAPHFISTVVLASMLNLFFDKNIGFVNNVIEALGGTRFSFLTSTAAYPHIYVLSGMWQSLGWGAIIYVAALAGVDPSLHESAMIDGATRMQRIIHINIPTILPTISIMLIMNAGHILGTSADKALLLKNSLNADAAHVIGTYVYERGLVGGDYSYTAAVGLFVNVINFIMLMTVNKITKKLTSTGLF